MFIAHTVDVKITLSPICRAASHLIEALPTATSRPIYAIVDILVFETRLMIQRGDITVPQVNAGACIRGGENKSRTYSSNEHLP